ncbi:MAG TPA: dTDP-4-dehydrorhamnose 3,5-epimerase [Polyangiaceae bacterium]|nr:dTDP-4-dehydrorhamnose 3,5-epimerase [Polyangiaceae bacterium]
MEVVELELAGLKLIKPRAFGDSRGFFLETHHAERYRRAGIGCDFVQDNHSRSVRDVVRGLHYQEHPGQAKLVYVTTGRVFDVAVDLRPDSATFGRWHGHYLDDREHHQLFIPIGFAHGYCVVSEHADFVYKVSAPYDPATERTLRWDDPDVGVEWPSGAPILSDRDRVGETFAEFLARTRR